MPFYPSVDTLTTVNELKNISYTITYVDTSGATGATGAGTALPVTITTTQPNGTVVLSGNTITGYYSGTFDNQIKYRTVDDNFITVTKWQDIAYAIANQTLSELYYYKADTTTRIIYQYTATAPNGDTHTYSINVDNDWQFGRNELIKYTNFTRYQQTILVEWINNNIGKVSWLNNVIEVIDWENNNL